MELVNYRKLRSLIHAAYVVISISTVEFQTFNEFLYLTNYADSIAF